MDALCCATRPVSFKKTRGGKKAFWRLSGGNKAATRHVMTVTAVDNVTENVFFFTNITTYLLRRKEKKTHAHTR